MIPRFLPLDQDDPRAVESYVLHARLGSGGMGRVYLSFTPGGRAIAIKVVRSEFADDPEFRARFRREVSAAQRVQGIYTASVVDADVEARVPWLATVYVPGPSLHRAVAEHGPLPLDTVSRLTGGVAEGLASVHAAGLIHRDLKPANVLLAEDGPRVIDFGIAHAADATTLTKVGVGIGTPAFMAPEQVRGAPVSPATDVFALGHLAFYAAAGHTAFGEGHQSAIVHRIGYEQPNLADCPERLRDLVERCLQKDPADRPMMSEIIEQARALYPSDRLNWLPPAVLAALAGYDTTTVFAARRNPAAGAGQGAAAPVVAPVAAGAFATTAPLKADAPGDAPPQAPAAPGTTAPVGNKAGAANAPNNAANYGMNAAGGAPFIAPTAPPGGAGQPPPRPYQSAAAWPGAPGRPGAPGGPAADYRPTSPSPYGMPQPPRKTTSRLFPALIGAAVLLIVVVLLAAHSFSGSDNPNSGNTPSGAPGPTDTGPTNAATNLSAGYSAEYNGVSFTMPGGSCLEDGDSGFQFTPSSVLFTQQGPQVSTNGGDADIQLVCNDSSGTGVTDIAPENIGIAEVTGTPSASDCYSAVEREPIAGDIRYTDLHEGMEFCMVGGDNDDQLVFLRLTSTNDSTFDLGWVATGWALPATGN
jgi:hypothetical protein